MILIKGDDRFVLVLWDNNMYNIIPMNDVQKFDAYEIDQKVKCKFNGNKYPGAIKFIGKFFSITYITFLKDADLCLFIQLL